MLCGRTSSIITAALSVLLALGMHMASGQQPATQVAAAVPAPPTGGIQG